MGDPQTDDAAPRTGDDGAAWRGSRRRFARLAAGAALGAAGSFAAGAGWSLAAAERFFVPETGHTLANPFLAHWRRHQGQTVMGLPVTEVVRRGARVAQYFEYGALILDASGGRELVAPLAVGRELLALSGEPGAGLAGRRIAGVRDPEARPPVAGVPARVADRLTAFHAEHGGVARFGQALTNPAPAGDVVAQWFEYGRLETDAEPDAAHVAVAAVGRELAAALGVETAPVRRRGLPVIELDRPPAYAGDGTIPEATRKFAPVRIAIPALAVDAPIEIVGIVDGVMASPLDPWSVGWYPAIAAPGDFSNAVVVGHRDWWTIGPVVFWNLSTLRGGERIYLSGADKRGTTYEVGRTWSIGAKDPVRDIVAPTPVESLTLITCGGAFDGVEYDQRLIVRAERV